MEDMVNPHTIIGELHVQFRTAQNIIKRLQAEIEDLKREIGHGLPREDEGSKQSAE